LEQILAKLLEHGLPGLLLAYFIWKNHDLTKRLRQLEDSRHVEVKENMETFSESRITLDLFKVEIRGKLEQIRDAIMQKGNK